MDLDVFVIDDQHPEDLAMLQALYSRSPASVTQHLQKMRQTGSGRFMEQYYVGYGHASIGDCGTTTCFIEQVSMLVAKAIQDNPLYNGQEASTRYLNFSQQSIIDPYDNPLSEKIQRVWMEIYDGVIPKLVSWLEKKYHFDQRIYQNKKTWENAIRARSFDIARSLLPIGTTTLLSWNTSLRQARDNLRRLKHHPLPEVRHVTQMLFNKLADRYPHSFAANDARLNGQSPRELYLEKHALSNHFLTPERIIQRFALDAASQARLQSGELLASRKAIDLDGLRQFESETLRSRPSDAPLPWRLEAYGRYNFIFLLDFGSFRDIQRHRNAVCQIPLIGGQFGMHPWYKAQFREMLSTSDSTRLEDEIASQFDRVSTLKDRGISTSNVMDQYLYPMGTMGLVHVAYSVPETVYVGELRSTKTVHPSLRPIAQKMLQVLSDDLPGIALHGDMDEDNWTPKRGEQTISQKPSQ